MPTPFTPAPRPPPFPAPPGAAPPPRAELLLPPARGSGARRAPPGVVLGRRRGLREKPGTCARRVQGLGPVAGRFGSGDSVLFLVGEGLRHDVD